MPEKYSLIFDAFTYQMNHICIGMLSTDFFIIFLKLEDDLVRARYVLSEGDAAAFLPTKSQGGILLILCCREFILHLKINCDGIYLSFCGYRELFEDVYWSY